MNGVDRIQEGFIQELKIIGEDSSQEWTSVEMWKEI